MQLEKKHYIQIAICTLICVISIALYCWYYKEYIAPESYTIGTPETMAYEKLTIKDYVSSDTVLFSQNINDSTFKVENGKATYNYLFDNKVFNGLLNNYAVFVNDTLLSDTQNAGTISGVYTIRYINADNIVFNTTDVDINFTFQSQSSVLRVSFDDKDDSLGLIMNYFKHNDFIITVCENPFTMDEVQTDDEFGRIECNVKVEDESRVYVQYNDALSTPTLKPLLVSRSGELKVFTVVSNNIKNINVETDGTYTVNYDAESYEYTITWQNANYLNIQINAQEAE